MGPTMPFGKHKGARLSAIPWDYLRWLTTIDLSPWLREAVEAELEAREGRGRQERRRAYEPPPPGPADLGRVDPALGLELVDAGRRALALRHHPDRGGDVSVMARVNDAADRLRDWFSRRLA